MEGQIIIRLYCDRGDEERRRIIKNYGNTFIAENICKDICATDLNIGPLGFYLFALKRYGEDNWLPPNQEIVCEKDIVQEFELRVRFIPSTEGLLLLNKVSKEAVHYFFLQCRHDFINECIRFKDDVGQDKILGLGVIDIMRWGKSKDYDIEKVKKLDPKEFIPSSTKRNYKLLFNAMRLKANFKLELEKMYLPVEDSSSCRDIEKRYIHGFLMYSKHYGLESYNSTSHSQLVVDVSDQETGGIFKLVDDEKKKICSLESLMDLRLEGQPDNPMVFLNRKDGVPEHIYFRDRASALSFMSLLDGYYRLSVDFHYCLGGAETMSPLVKRLEILKCHGPVSANWAQRRLLEKHHSNSQFNYLLKQTQSTNELDSYMLVFLSDKTRKPQYGVIERKTGSSEWKTGFVQDRSFKSLEEVIRYLKTDNKEKILLTRFVRPENPLDPDVYLCKHRGTEERPVDKKKDEHAPKLIPAIDSSAMQVIANGKFTTVSSLMWNKNGEKKPSKVACKRLKDEYKLLLEDFTMSAHRALHWNSPLITTIFGICLAPFQVLEEFAQLGNLEAFLVQEGQHLKEFQLVGVADQMASALMYLDELRLPEHHMGAGIHGNIRTRNILVFSINDKNQLHVKLGDPGLVALYERLPLDHPLTVERLPWLAPELLKTGLDYTDISPSADIYSYGVTLIELFTLGQRPMAPLDGKNMMIQVLFKGGIPVPDSITNKELEDVIKNCVKRSPDDRPTARDLVRDISRLAFRVQAGHSYTIPSVMSNGHMSPGVKVTDSAEGQLEVEGHEAESALQEILLKCKSRTRYKSASLNTSASAIESIESIAANCSFAWETDSLAKLIPSVPSSETDSLNREPGFDNPAMSISGDGISIPDCIINMRNTHHVIDGRCISFERNRDKLGQGFYGEVYKANYFNPYNSKKELVAVKALKADHIEKYQDEFQQEFEVMTQLRHENIVQIVGQVDNYSQEMPFMIVMEYVGNGCLRKYLKDCYNLAQKPPSNDVNFTLRLLKFGREIASGMQYLHSMKLIHRDLATRNVLVTSNEHAKISDFGLARKLDNYYTMGDKGKPLPMWWCAPESMEFQKFYYESDIWSYGVTFWEVLHVGMEPRLVKQIPQLLAALKRNKRLPHPKFGSNRLYDECLMKCWELEKENRCTWTDIRAQISKETEDLNSQRADLRKEH